MFEKTLTDVVKGIRASKRDTSKYISQCISEIKYELNSSDMYIKANAIQKLTFLQMMGFSMNWDRASFTTIEVMSSSRFAHKRIGYLAASQGFTQHTEVVLLATNLLQKELRGAVGSTNMNGVYEAGLAINCISNIVTEDLARDLLPELTRLTTHPQPYLRKKAILCLFKLFVKYPQGLRLTFTRIQQCLEDPNPSVVSCAVNVITELSDKNPKNYLHLAPSFFQLLTQSSNNWMLIKVVKLLGSLVPEEPRLARKLLDPLANIVRTTQAKSLLYESVRTITLCLPYCRKNDGTVPTNVPEIVDLCANTLLDFVKQTDQNLKYLGLVGFSYLMQSHPLNVLSVPEYRPLILTCLTDPDVTIRTRALDLLTGMASKKNLMELITQLLNHVELATGSYKKDLVSKIIEMCSGDKYSRMTDFKWYLDVLFQLGHYRGIDEHGDLLMGQVLNVALRVVPIRPYAVRRSIELLLEGDGSMSEQNSSFGNNGRGKHLMVQLLPSIAWILGEYSDQIQSALYIDPEEKNGAQFKYDMESKGTYHAIIQCLTSPHNIQKLPTSTQKVYVQASMKILAAASSSNKGVSGNELVACVTTIYMSLPFYTQSTDVEVVERSYTLLELIKSLRLVPDDINEQNNYSVDDGKVVDLLKIDDKSGSDTAITSSISNGDTSSKGLESRIRSASSTLVYMLKPSPMKPIPPKAQKKKREAPLGVTIDINAPMDMSILHELIDSEETTRKSVKDVSFVQQTPHGIEEPKASAELKKNSLGKKAENSAEVNVQTSMISSTGPSATKPKKGDPFYLESVPSADSNDESNTRRFEAIRLPSSSDEESREPTRDKKKTKKKKKVKDDFNIMIGSTDHVDFDSDEDDNNNAVPKRKGRNREFAGLAKVDLTTPLRDDEVMPERTHRVVPERKVKQHKKSKKEKKKSSATPEMSSAVADLLDLGNEHFESTNNTLQPTMPISNVTRIPAANLNPISTAFDDLLSLATPTPMTSETSSPHPMQSHNVPHSISSFDGPIPFIHSSKIPWMKASLKLSNATGDVVDWSSIAVLYQAAKISEGTTIGGQFQIQIHNRSSLPLYGLAIELREYGIVRFDSIPGSSKSNFSDKIGPIYFKDHDNSQEVKAVLRWGASTIPVKLQLPVTLSLQPVRNLSLERVAQELTTGNWSSTTAKVELASTTDVAEAKGLLSAFLNAEFVLNSNLSPETGTYAAYSMSGAQVRFLVKIKERSAKIDIKSTSVSLNKAIAADLKRLIL